MTRLHFAHLAQTAAPPATQPQTPPGMMPYTAILDPKFVPAYCYRARAHDHRGGERSLGLVEIGERNGADIVVLRPRVDRQHLVAGLAKRACEPAA